MKRTYTMARDVQIWLPWTGKTLSHAKLFLYEFRLREIGGCNPSFWLDFPTSSAGVFQISHDSINLYAYSSSREPVLKLSGTSVTAKITITRRALVTLKLS